MTVSQFQEGGLAPTGVNGEIPNNTIPVWMVGQDGSDLGSTVGPTDVAAGGQGALTLALNTVTPISAITTDVAHLVIQSDDKNGGRIYYGPSDMTGGTPSGPYLLAGGTTELQEIIPADNFVWSDTSSAILYFQIYN